MPHDPDAELTQNLRLRLPSHWYGLAALTVITGFCSIVPRAVSFAADGRLNALRPLPSDASLRRSLLVAARPKVVELRKKLAARSAVAETHGLFLRAPECIIKDIADTRVQHGKDGNITGLVFVSCVWKSTDQRTFDSREDAQDAELTESEPGKLRLTFVWLGEHWAYKGAKKEP